MQTYSLKRQEQIKAPAGEPVQASKADVRRLRVVTVAEGLSFAEAKRQRALDRSLTIVPERNAHASADDIAVKEG